MENKKLSSLLVITGIVIGAIGSVGVAAYAQSSSTPLANLATTSKVNDGQEVGEKEHEKHDKVDQVAIEAKATIKTAQAVAVAEASAGTKSVRHTVEEENGVISYDIFFTDKKIEVDGTTGAITGTETQHEGGFSGHRDEQDENDVNEVPGTEEND